MSDVDADTEPTAPPTRRRRLERAKSGRMLAGVCEGLGRYFHVDPVIFRIGFVVAVFAGGAGAIAYLVAILVMPEEGSRRAPIHLGRHTPTWVPWLLIGIGVLALADGFDHDGFPFFWWLLALGVAAWFLWSHDARTPPDAHLPTDSRSPTDPGPDTAPLSEDAEPAAAAAVPRSRSILGRLTLSVLLVGAGVGLAIAGASDDVTGMDVEAFLGGALVVVGAALVVGAWWGRARALIALGVVLTVGAASASVVDVPLRGGIGERRWAPVADSEVRRVYRLGIGDAELDLTRTDADRITTDVSLGVGHLVVMVPRDATVVVDAHTGLGELVVLGRESHGTDLDESVRSPGSELGPTVDLDVRLGVGQLEVIRDPS
jgi:phage shock protein PspC (stress-responsive transcriptional regulator)